MILTITFEISIFGYVSDLYNFLNLFVFSSARILGEGTLYIGIGASHAVRGDIGPNGGQNGGNGPTSGQVPDTGNGAKNGNGNNDTPSAGSPTAQVKGNPSVVGVSR